MWYIAKKLLVNQKTHKVALYYDEFTLHSQRLLSY